MSIFNYLVTVETERDSGLIASRDEQSEPIAEEIEQAVSAVAISGIGARSDSEYSVASVDVMELEKKDMRVINADYEAAVKAEEPGDAQLRRELRVARQDIAAKDRRIIDLERKLAKQIEQQEASATSVFMGGAWDDERRTYLPDGIHDHIHYKFGERSEDKISISRERGGNLEVRSDSAHFYPAVQPVSGNVLRIIMVER